MEKAKNQLPYHVRNSLKVLHIYLQIKIGFQKDMSCFDKEFLECVFSHQDRFHMQENFHKNKIEFNHNVVV